MEKRDIPRPGEFYRHFKNRLYQIIAVAFDAETEKQLVVYQALYGDYRIWARPLEEFLSRTDRKKYPEARQEWRFERVMPASPSQKTAAPTAYTALARSDSEQTAPADQTAAAQTAPADQTAAAHAAPAEQSVPASEVLLAFLDAESREEKKAVLVSGMGRLTQRELDSIYMALDMPAQEGDVRSQVSGILSWMRTQERYESTRLRDAGKGIIRRKV